MGEYGRFGHNQWSDFINEHTTERLKGFRG